MKAKEMYNPDSFFVKSTSTKNHKSSKSSTQQKPKTAQSTRKKKTPSFQKISSKNVETNSTPRVTVTTLTSPSKEDSISTNVSYNFIERAVSKTKKKSRRRNQRKA